MKPATIALIVCFVVVVIVLIIVVTLLIIENVVIASFKNATIAALTNQDECVTDSSKCGYLSGTFPAPTVITSGFSKDVALFNAQLVMNVEYSSKNNGNLFLPTDFVIIGLLYTQETNAPVFGACVLDQSSGILYIAIRGTVTNQEWKYDFTFQQVPFLNTTANVHKGFYSVFQQISPNIHTFLTSNIQNVKQIVVTGHSLGAAVCSMVSYYCWSVVSDLSIPVFCYAFAKPRVGDANYQSLMNSTFPNQFFRVQNSDDLVPQLPLAATPNLQNNATPWIYDHEGTEIQFTQNWNSLGLNHLMNIYINFLKQL
jgi:hypothetical protein